MTPWLTVVLAVQPSQPERIQRLVTLLREAPQLAHDARSIAWQVFPQEGHGWSSAEKWRQAIATCATDWLWMLADDAHVLTPNWDTMLRTGAETGQFDLLHGHDGRFGQRLAVFPCLRVSFARRVLPDLAEYHSYRIDDHVFDVARRAGRAGYLPDLLCLSHETFTVVPYFPEPTRYALDDAAYRRSEPYRDALVKELTVRELTPAI